MTELMALCRAMELAGLRDAAGISWDSRCDLAL